MQGLETALAEDGEGPLQAQPAVTDLVGLVILTSYVPETSQCRILEPPELLEIEGQIVAVEIEIEDPM